jgi:hypothetical protein
LTFPDITVKGQIGYENLSDVIIHLGIEVAATFYPFASIPPGDVGKFAGAATNYFAKADSGTDKSLRLFVVEQ